MLAPSPPSSPVLAVASRTLVWEPGVEHAEAVPSTASMNEHNTPPPPSNSESTVTTAMASSAWMSTPLPTASVDREKLRAELRELRRLELRRRGHRQS